MTWRRFLDLASLYVAAFAIGACALHVLEFVGRAQ